jgi:hypothetical protein
MFDNPSDVDSLLEQFSRSTSQSEKAVSQDLKDLVDIGSTDAPPVVELKAWPPPNMAQFTGSAPPPAPDVDDLLAMTDDALSSPPPTPTPTPTPAPAPRAPAPRKPIAKLTPAPAPAPAPPPSVRPLSSRELPTRQSLAVAEWAKPKKRRTDYWIIIAILALLAASSATVWFFKPGFLSGRTSEKVAEEKAANEAIRQKQLLAQQEKSCKAAIDVTDVPTGAEVLLRVGQAPIDVPHLPVGARLEFVATAEGFAPKRAVVPSGATWDTGPDGKPRFEVGVQLDKSNPKLKLGDPWPPGDPGSEVGGKGAPGTVHLVSTPKGAEVWMLAGLGPEALIEQLPCDQSVDVLVAGPTTFRKRLHAAPSDFSARPGEASSKIAKLSAHP